MTEFVFVTGMFRSGTTLLAKMLDAHGAICCANDAYLPLFKTFRNEVEAGLAGAGPEGAAPDRNRPLDAYYFDQAGVRLMRAIEAAGFERALSAGALAEAREGVHGYAAEFSPAIAERAGALEGASFAELLRSAFLLVKEAYGGPGTTTMAFKTAWTDEYIGHVLEALPGARAINIIRDPRAVCASKNARADKYPWLFLIRQWRKLAAFAWLARESPRWRERVLTIRYESLIAEPAAWAERVCAFLGLEHDPAMADPRTYKGTEGGTWTGNSSHFENVLSFNAASVDRWKGTLQPAEIEYIEHLCWPEMGLFGYRPVSELGASLPDGLLFDPPRVPEESLARWIRPYEIRSGDDLVREMAFEGLRYRASVSDAALSEEVARLLFLDPAVREAARKSPIAKAKA